MGDAPLFMPAVTARQQAGRQHPLGSFPTKPQYSELEKLKEEGGVTKTFNEAGHFRLNE